MKKAVMIVAVVLLAVGGCYREAGYVNPATGETKTTTEYLLMTEEAKAAFTAAVIEGIRPDILAKLDPITGGAENIAKAAKPFIPSPFREMLEIGLAALAGWNIYKKRTTATLLGKIKLGAQITAKTIDEVVRPATEVWDKFKASQRLEENLAARLDTPVLMPDKV